MKYWEKTCSESSPPLGSVRFLQAAAECLPLADGTADIVYIVYLFHELPPEVRRKVLNEVHRVLKEGGLFVLTDSIQLGDSLSADGQLHQFGALNEPWPIQANGEGGAF
ncbi:Methyltransferase [Gracilaria domingensis]|nr:Methyltransferase [Gracilaria domingensis]